MTTARRVLLPAVPARAVHPDRGSSARIAPASSEGLQLLAVYAVLGVVVFFA